MCSSSVEPTIVPMISYFSFLFFSLNGLKQVWHLVARLCSLICDFVSGSNGCSGKESYSLLASEIMCL